MRASRSWQVTVPLRRLNALLQRLRAGGSHSR
jgi:hypothetical protein